MKKLIAIIPLIYTTLALAGGPSSVQQVPLPLSLGGTGGTTAAAARTSLGLGTAATTNSTAYDAAGAATSAQAFAIQRANHTGTQSYTTITGLGTAATANSTAFDAAGAAATAAANAAATYLPIASPTFTGTLTGNAGSINITNGGTQTIDTLVTVASNNGSGGTQGLLSFGRVGSSNSNFTGTVQGDLVVKAYSSDASKRLFLGATSGSSPAMVLTGAGRTLLGTTSDDGTNQLQITGGFADNVTFSSVSAVTNGITFNGTDSTTGTGGYNGLAINITGSGTGTGNKYPFNVSVGGSSVASIDKTGLLKVGGSSSAFNTMNNLSLSGSGPGGYALNVSGSALLGNLMTPIISYQNYGAMIIQSQNAIAAGDLLDVCTGTFTNSSGTGNALVVKPINSTTGTGSVSVITANLLGSGTGSGTNYEFRGHVGALATGSDNFNVDSSGNLFAAGAYLDSTASKGTTGQVLTSTATGTKWSSNQTAAIRVVTASGAVTMTTSDTTVVINKTTGAATAVALPSSPYTGEIVYVKDGKGDANSNPITITPAAGTIDGAATYSITTVHAAVELQYDGNGNWWLI